MLAQANINIHNRFDIEVLNEKTGKTKHATAYNMILNSMWTRLCGGSSYFTNIHFGTGSGTLLQTRTSLFAHLGTKAAANEEIIRGFPISTWKRKIIINPEEFVGQTFREVGISFDSGTSSLVTHAMLEDSEGNPISILKTSLDVITIYATAFITFNTNSTDVVLTHMPNDNQLINWLAGGSSAPTGTFSLGENGEAGNQIMWGLGSAPELGSTATATWTSDIPNRRRISGTMRFGISVGNGHVAEFIFNNIFRARLPLTGVFTGQPYAGVPIGTGDGVTRDFILPSRNIRQPSLEIKINGATTTAISPSLVRQTNFRRPNPVTLPTGSGWGAALSADGNVLAIAHDTTPFMSTYDCAARTTNVRFNIAPPAGASITADYIVDGVHKTDQFVIDVGFTIQFGEVI